MTTIAVDASDKIAVKTKGSCKIYQVVGYPQYPESKTLLSELSNGTYTSSAFSSATTIEINNTGESEVHYSVGVDAVVLDGAKDLVQGTPGVLNATGALTAAMISSGIVTSTTAAAVAGTVPTGTVMDAAVEMAIGDALDFSVIATGANAFTVTAATGITIVGDAVVATATSGLSDYARPLLLHLSFTDWLSNL